MLKRLQHLKSYLLTFLFFTKILLVDCRGGIGTFLTRKVHNDVEPGLFRLRILERLQAKNDFILSLYLEGSIPFSRRKKTKQCLNYCNS